MQKIQLLVALWQLQFYIIWQVFTYIKKKPDKTTRNLITEFITPLEKGLTK